VSSEADRCVGEEELAFCGLIGADVSHEVRNVFAVIGEYAGLLDDLLELAAAGQPADYAKLRDLCAKVVRQVRKGTETMERFSRFAHAADAPTASFDVTALVGNMAALVQRRVAQAGGQLEVELPGKAIPARGNPFSLQQAMFLSLDIILQSMKKEEPVRMKLASLGPAVLLRFSAVAANGVRPGSNMQRLTAILGRWKGTSEIKSANGVLTLTLTIPVS
jgi:C4-dicarboxylate-specific signal transduction histidine kinase